MKKFYFRHNFYQYIFIRALYELEFFLVDLVYPLFTTSLLRIGLKPKWFNFLSYFYALYLLSCGYLFRLFVDQIETGVSYDFRIKNVC